jgi:sulfate adenylyltransferase subunit 1
MTPLLDTMPRSVLRFMTAGSVDDGKSTLIGRLLFDSKGLMRDQIAAISKAKHARGAAGEIDLALVTDGLESEREQGITIDVAYRYFATPQRAFIIADAPGHEQYTRNMVTAASTAEVVVILIDAPRATSNGLMSQTRRHAAIAQLMGLDVIVAVNKMDLLGWSRDAFDGIVESFSRVARVLDFEPRAFVPISALSGDNVARRGDASWYDGPSLIELLETIEPRASTGEGPFRFPVQRIARWDDGADLRRGYQGRVESGRVEVGDTIVVAPSLTPAVVREIRTFEGPRLAAETGRSVSIVLDREVDVSRGDMLTSPDVRLAKAVTADLCWLDGQDWIRGRKYLLRQGAKTSHAMIETIHHIRDMAELAVVRDADALHLNDIASVRVKALDPLVADTFGDAPATGAFVLIDPVSHQTAAAGMIREAHDAYPSERAPGETWDI